MLKIAGIFYLLCLVEFLLPAAEAQNVSFVGQEPFRSYISSGAVKDSHVYRLLATSTNDGSITYSVQADDPEDLSYFKVAGNVIQIAKSPLPQQSTFYLTIQASQGDESVSANLTVNVLPTSETAPVFEHNTYSASVTENGETDELVAFAQAFSLSVTSTTSYLILDGNTDGAFAIDSSTGVISTSKSLDRESVAQYALSVSYIDEVGSAYATVNVKVVDENDNSPIFSQSLYVFEVNETSVSGDNLVGTLSASDSDTDNNGKITFTIVDDKNEFYVNSDGDLITNIALDYEQVQQYMLQVKATDNGVVPKSAVTTVFVRIKNNDDECPVFSNSNSVYIKDIPYNPGNQPSTGFLLSVSATDPDNFGEITYQIVSGNEKGLFAINMTNGNISLIKVDDSITGQYRLFVSASDSSCFNTSIAQVEIAIGNSNLNTPQFTSDSCSATLDENPAIGTSVTVLVATDGDVGSFGQITYAIVQNVGDFKLFSVDPVTGNLTTTGSPGLYDREKKSSLSIGVTATDGGFYQDFCILSITILDMNDNYPSFDGEEYDITINSNEEYVLEIEAQDPDFGDNGVVSYSLKPAQGTSATGCPFTIDSQSGVITVANNSAITEELCIMVATASDGGSPALTSSAFVNISIDNTQEIPVFDEKVYIVNITENLASTTVVLTVSATVQGNSDTIVYTIKKGSDYRTNGNDTFVMTGNGRIEVGSKNVPDYESLYPGPYSFRLLVTARASASGASSIAIVEINVEDLNDNSPVFVDNEEAVITLMVVEERPSGKVGAIKATDADYGDYGIIEYNYTYNSDNPIGMGVFEVQPNGNVMLLVDGLDAEDPNTLASYEYFITATNLYPPGNDRVGTVHLEIIIQDINDSPPSFSNSTYRKTLNESHPLTTVLEISATDPDTVGGLNYDIVSGNEGATFQIDSDNGNLKLKRALDYESIQEYTMIIQVSDGVFQDTATAIITVLDIDDEAPVFAESMYVGVVSENAPPGTSLLTVQATDVDTDMIVYEVQGQAVDRFTISSNGVISVSGLIDREEFLPSAQIFFLVFAYGGSLGTTSVLVNITDVNDYVPQFILSPYYGTAPENTSPGSNGLYIVTVKAIDFDQGQNGTVKYSIVSGEDNGFRIDPDTGVITGITVFDREEQRFYSLTVQAIDTGVPIQLFSTVEVIVEITDHNDNPPYWPYPYMYARVYESAQVGKLVIKLPANDPDNGVNSSVVFELTGGNLLNKFSLDPNTGEIKVALPLDYEKPEERVHFLYFSIRDNGIPPLDGLDIGELEIHVLDSNDHQPSFNNPSLFISLDEDTPTGTVVTVLTASDNDSSLNSDIIYSIDSGNVQDTFGIVKNENGSGVLYLQKPLDHEATSAYYLTISASDQGYPIESSQIVTTVLINDVNDEQPLFTQDVYYGFINENGATSVSILQVQVSDPDSDTIPGGKIDRYQLLNNTNTDFMLSSNWIVGPANLDRETISEYVFTVIAVDDHPTEPLTGTATVVITVLDSNDNPSQDGGTRNIYILANDGVFNQSEIGTPYFIDPDDNDTFTGCTIQSGDDHLFTVDPNNCFIFITDHAALQPGINFELVIRGNDGMHPPVLSTTYISITNVAVTNPSSHLLTASIKVTPEEFLDDIYSSINSQLSSATSSSVSLFSVSNEGGSHVDVTFTTSDDSSITGLIQSVFVGKGSLPFLVYSLPVDPCVSEPCFNNAECSTSVTIPTGYHSNKISSTQAVLFSPVVSIEYECLCVPGTTGEHCETNYNDCYSSPCLNGASCIDEYYDYSCDCPPGTSGKDCAINPDECTTSPSPCQNNAACSNGFDSPVCACTDDFYGDLCQYSYFEPSSFCDSSPCLNGATCSPGRDSYTCICTEDFTGDNCEREIQFQGGCVQNPCYNGSTCIENAGGFVCECSVGFTGPLCRFPLNNCELEYCRNGACEMGVYGAYYCECDPGYTNENCSELVDLCSSTPCQNGGTCANNGTLDFYCECSKEYYGNLCQYHVQPPDLCSNNQFCNSNNSICSSGQSSFTCHCTNGYSNEYCTDNEIPTTPCDSNPCLHGGNCSNNGNDFTCTCPGGYTGDNCETDINECANDPCNNGATCLDGFGSYLCQCDDGFAGRHCEITCPVGYIGDYCETQVDMCLNNPCQNEGTCQTQYGSHQCSCPTQYTGTNCETENDCSVNTCYNGGSCSNSDTTGHYCDCIESTYSGSHCELTTVSFTGTASTSSYRVYDSLSFRSDGTVEMEFATRSRNGLLLLATQHNEGQSLDFLAVEIHDGVLYVLYSLGDQVNMVEATSSSASITDGNWHSISIDLNGKDLSLSVDHCNTIVDLTQFTVDCNYQTSSNGSLKYLDTALPLWLGGAPLILPNLPVNSVGSNACIRNVKIDGVLLDLQSHVEERNANNGCPQIDGSCDSVDCGSGSCVTEWNSYYCNCPPGLVGGACEIEATSLSYGGKTYGEYTLVTSQNSKRQVTTPTSLISSYEESISLWFRTVTASGILIQLGNTGLNSYVILKLSSAGNVQYLAQIGSNTSITMTVPMTSTDGRWHNVSVTRRGLNVRLSYDHNYNNDAVITGSDLILSYHSNEVYIAGRPGDNERVGVVSDGFTGCIQDVRHNQRSLPTSGSNDIATVEFKGDPPSEGCNVGVCFPNPCGEEGECIEIDEESYRCNCSNGEMVTGSSCDRVRGGTSWSPIIAILVSLGVFIILLVIALIIGLTVVYHRVMRWHKTETAVARLNDISRPMSDHSLDDYEIHENVYQYDVEDGEDDTSTAGVMRRSRESLTPDGPVVIANKKTQPVTPDNRTPDGNIYSRLEGKKVKYSPGIGRKPSATQDINTFIESRVNDANTHVLDLDSLMSFRDEGVLSGASSLSSICSNTGHEPYTITRLRLAGPDFDRIADLLEPVLVPADSVSETTSMTDEHESGIGADGEQRTINLALMHEYN